MMVLPNVGKFAGQRLTDPLDLCIQIAMALHETKKASRVEIDLVSLFAFDYRHPRIRNNV